jgi:ferrous iron transport protein B
VPSSQATSPAAVAVPARRQIALAGNPNTGKTTLFNVLTGSRARVGNYPGVTVERRVGEAELAGVGEVDVLDVPGTYSLVARTGEEQFAIDAMLGLGGQPRPAAVVICVDATQFVRGSHLVLQALEFGLPVVVALTMTDEAKDAAPDAEALGRHLGCEAVPVIAAQGRGVSELRAAIARRLGAPEQREIWHWQPSPWLRQRLDQVREVLPEAWPACDAMALWALESIEPGDELSGIPEGLRRAVALEPDEHKRVDDEAICGRYAWMDRELAPLGRHEPDRRRTEKVDRLLLHPWLGMLIFLALMFVLFLGLFSGADPLIHLIEELFAGLGDLVKSALPPGLLARFLADGLLAGVGAVVVFLPQILLLFFLLGLLEDSGYMARVAYLMDRPMRTMHLHGRAFVPMLSGFACAVPAILATRTMERRRDRLLAMLTIPLTTCSARLPVYTLIIASLFPGRRIAGFLPTQALLIVFMYAFGMATALLAALVLAHAMPPLRSRRLPLVLELPPYRMPRLRDVAAMMWERARRFLTDAGTVIVICSVVLWGLLNFPARPAQPSRDWEQAMAVAPAAERGRVHAAREAERVQQSYAGRLGHALEPVIAPLGFDWKIGIGLIGAFASREVFVATLGVVYGSGDEGEHARHTLREKLRNEKRPDGTPLYTPLVGLSLLLFFALACQCASTLAVVRRETASWRWPAFLFLYTTALAWLVSFAAYQLGRSVGL